RKTRIISPFFAEATRRMRFLTPWKRPDRRQELAPSLPSQLSPDDPLWTVLGAADPPTLDTRMCQLIANAVGKRMAHHQNHADAHVKDLVHLRLFDSAHSLQPGEDWRNGPAAPVNDDLHARRNDAGQVLVQPA